MLAAGNPAPDFALLDSRGDTVALSDYRGSWVVLWWYPEANSRGCSLQAASLERRLDDIQAAGAVVIGASFNTPEENDAFVCDKVLRYRLVSDTTRRAGQDYGVIRGADQPYSDKPNRRTFIIDPDGDIAFAEDANEVDLTRYAEHILEVLGDLSAGNPRT